MGCATHGDESWGGALWDRCCRSVLAGEAAAMRVVPPWWRHQQFSMARWTVSSHYYSRSAGQARAEAASHIPPWGAPSPASTTLLLESTACCYPPGSCSSCCVSAGRLDTPWPSWHAPLCRMIRSAAGPCSCRCPSYDTARRCHMYRRRPSSHGPNAPSCGM